MAKNAKNVFPVIQQNIENLTDEFSKSVSQSTKENNRMLEAQRDGINKQIEILTKSHKDFEIQQAQMNEKNTQRITEQISNLDKELQNELTKVLTQMGQGLVSISNKFSQDYNVIAETIMNLQNALRKANNQ